MDYVIKSEGGYKYIETGDDKQPLILLHGLFGTMSNFDGIMQHFSPAYNVVVPILPIFELPLRKVSVSGLVEHVAEFVEYKKFRKVHVLGNSLGGHIALLYALGHPDKIASIILTGSSGLFESSMGTSFPPGTTMSSSKKRPNPRFSIRRSLLRN